MKAPQSHNPASYAIIPADFCILKGFPDRSVGKESACSAGDLDSINELGRFCGEGKGYPFQYSGLENSMDYTWGHKELNKTEQLTL